MTDTDNKKENNYDEIRNQYKNQIKDLRLSRVSNKTTDLERDSVTSLN